MKVGGWYGWKSGGLVRFSHYEASGEDAILIVEEDGSPIATATVALWPPAPSAPEGQVWLKTWGAYDGLAEALQAAGILTLEDQYHPTGYEVAQLATLTPAAIAFRDANQAPEAKAAQIASRSNPR